MFLEFSNGSKKPEKKTIKEKKLFLKTPIKVPKRIKCESEKGVEWSGVECVTAIVYSVSLCCLA